MAGFADSPRRTALDAHAADSLGIKQTVGMVIFIGTRSRRNLDLGYNRTAANRLALGSYQSVAEPEGPKAGRIGSMPL